MIREAGHPLHVGLCDKQGRAHPLDGDAETSRHGVSVFSIQPGTARTEMARGFWTFKPEIFEEGRDVSTDPATELMFFLVSGKADAVSRRFFAFRKIQERWRNEARK
jgi:hypothetical protein